MALSTDRMCSFPGKTGIHLKADASLKIDEGDATQDIWDGMNSGEWERGEGQVTLTVDELLKQCGVVSGAGRRTSKQKIIIKCEGSAKATLGILVEMYPTDRQKWHLF